MSLRLLVTNNPLAVNAFRDKCLVSFVQSDYMGVLFAVRDAVHKGCFMLTHPLSGSVKPNENPFKSILLNFQGGLTSFDKGQNVEISHLPCMDKTDLDSVSLIENAIITAKKFPVKFKSLTDAMRDDFAKIDCSLILSIL